MSAQHITAAFIIGILVLVAVYDIAAVDLWGSEGTISGVLRRLGERWPLFPPLVAFAMGALFGHLFL